MTEETTNLPVSWQDQMKADAKALIEAERPSMAIMSLKSGVMTIGEEQVPNNEIDCIILASVSANSWYKDRYDPNVKSNPTCYAIGEGKGEDLIPYEESAEKQYEYCYRNKEDMCPKFEWGSDPNGGRGKACKERRNMMIIPSDGSADAVLLSIPPTSLKAWANYAREIVISTGMTPIGVITKIKVVPDAKNQFAVKFSKVDDVAPHLLEKLMARRPDALQQLLAPYPVIEEPQKEAKKRKF
jgi:hypothetical protein